MKTFLQLLIIATIMSSCATIFHKKEYMLRLSTNVENSKIQINDSVIDLPARVKVKRSREDLFVTLLSDSIKRNFLIRSSPSMIFMFGNLLWLEFCPIAYAVDFFDHQGFYYGKSVNININSPDSVLIPQETPLAYFSRDYPTNTGQVNFTFSIPLIVTMYQKPTFKPKESENGFGGVSLGMEYYYKSNKYIALNAQRTAVRFDPISERHLDQDLMRTTYLTLTDNFRFNRFSIGYGINFAHNNWGYNDFGTENPTVHPNIVGCNSLGLTLNTYHQIGNKYYIGIIYCPTILRMNPGISFKYDQLISLDFALKYRIKK